MSASRRNAARVSGGQDRAATSGRPTTLLGGAVRKWWRGVVRDFSLDKGTPREWAEDLFGCACLFLLIIIGLVATAVGP